ncbi:MAG: 2-amino-4-hydroxy-6-hydroxymethyldihydropteridine diphosphokinase [Ornithinimicrobium sp.]
MADTISLVGVRAFGRHGVLPSERRDGQDFVVDVALDLDVSLSGASDDVADTVNYAEVASDVVAILEGEPRNLIETVATDIADTLLARYPLTEQVTITLHKPHAPVGVPFSDVAVTLTRRRDVPVVIAVGANLGDPEIAVRRALEELAGIPGVWAVTASGLFRTKPVGGPAQGDYVNAVAMARTCLPPRRLLATLHAMEDRAGRTRTLRWEARTLDLDLIQYGDPAAGSEVVSSAEDLLLPHPRAQERAFVLVPWSAVDPGAVLSDHGRLVPVTQLLARLDTSGVETMEESS